MKYSRDLWTRMQFLIVSFLSACIVIAIGVGLQWWWPAPRTAPVARVSTLTPPIARVSPSPIGVPAPLAVPSPVILPSPVLPSPEPKMIRPAPAPIAARNPAYLGHFPYLEVDRSRLVRVGMYYDRPEYLEAEAADAFARTREAARAEGVNLTIISGFRSVADQEKLFTRQIQRRGSRSAAARLSAPPGYSEHHTGYALDIGDGDARDTDLKYDFERTRAYRWLAARAGQYGFELSFPRDNPQGVSFEPWHWRYVGSEAATGVFASARYFSGGL
ncbi:D-alanyl-D-alanine carboxypeptidase family protein [Pannus brasiliensis CCIBt3594]|uniref:D-alanyl-D-alanine carboxypeptidase family protein n=1 Tax=Pannus brasiliensis CCIBt3594 TaxID=1427578 RepID=A0AAW9QPM3_9CHRO